MLTPGVAPADGAGVHLRPLRHPVRHEEEANVAHEEQLRPPAREGDQAQLQVQALRPQVRRQG